MYLLYFHMSCFNNVCLFENHIDLQIFYANIGYHISKVGLYASKLPRDQIL